MPMREVPALARGLSIVQLLAAERRPMRITEIAAQLALPRSATYELVNTLRNHRVIDVSTTGDVTLGPLLLVLGTAYSETVDLGRLAHGAARSVSDASSETAQVAILDGRHVIYIAKAESSSRQFRLISAVGRRLPAHVTGVGKALLAALPPAELDELLRDVVLEGFTANSITDPAVLRRELEGIRRDGYAFDDCESNDDVRCVAAAVTDAVGQVVAAISISVPKDRMTPGKRVECRKVATDGAAEMSRRLGASLEPRPEPPAGRALAESVTSALA